MRRSFVALVVAATMIVVGVAASAHSTRRASRLQMLLFQRDDRLFLMRDDGSNQRRAPFPSYPVYSPDGRRVLLTAYNQARTAESLFVANADGSGRRKVAPPGSCLGSGEWSPDGSKITYEDYACGIDFTSIWVVDRDGRHRKRLTGRWNFAPEWSPDGGTILFTSIARPRGWRLFLMDADGRHRREIRGRYPESKTARYYARWSPDGRRIFFLSEPTKQLFSMNTDGTGLRNLTPSHVTVGAFDVSPKGRLVAAHGATGNGRPRDIYVVQADGTSVQLTKNRAVDQYPAWSPDGTKIAFESNRDGNFEIYVMNADGSGQTNLSRNRADDTSPSWVPPKRA